ncbi:SPOR domain-containing protein [Chitiniphilus purpureus]|uniref:SPOR domain-containing protein n=1 Tax=Chitiniphilus purpureus TaxID=2981137 RepID=A0ABY6DK25_9NEIS|nr:SPOR domain-containing protein [Chitiniphilus sp. CD1]UXY14694.1 SPOR domain-containing protein [Chitiniphilus sp. CD1]
MKKTLFLILILLFGALLFLAGLLAPLHWKNEADTGLRSAAARLGLTTPPPAHAASAAVPAPAAASTPPPAVLAEALIVPALPPAQADYGLQVAQLASYEAAQGLLAQARTQKVAARIVTVADEDGSHWYVLAAGPYPSVDAAKAARPLVARYLGVEAGMPVIVLPAAPAKPG